MHQAKKFNRGGKSYDRISLQGTHTTTKNNEVEVLNKKITIYTNVEERFNGLS